MKRELLNEEVDQIINQSFWQKGGIRVSDPKRVQENTEVEHTEGEEGHVCPLCEHIISEPISNEKLAEHIELMLSIISEVHSISDEELEAIEEAIEQEMYGDSEDDDETADDEDSDDEDSDEVDA